jgi:septal ring factor EnvC (AmiA/AmiB activator)
MVRQVVAVGLVASGWVAASLALEPPGDPRSKRLDALQGEMRRLQQEMDGLAAKERTLLGDVARMDAELALRRAQLEDVSLRRKETEDRLAGSERALAVLASDRARRAPRLAARLREVYKRGPVEPLARLVGPLGATDGLDGLRYATFLSHRDASQLAAWRTTSGRISDERATLSAEHTQLAALESESARRASALSAGRDARASLLARIRGDREQHAQAYGELEEAARQLGKLVLSFEDRGGPVALDIRKFKGLLDWPAAGPVSARFGTIIHPKFRTEVPHPGVDIDAPEGETFRAVFDGRVAYAAPLTGYGLTLVVDHGHGIMSIYAHAQILTVAAGDDVTRGQEVGRVGETGSLRGPYLYFELRDGGHPIDPAAWIRRN